MNATSTILLDLYSFDAYAGSGYDFMVVNLSRAYLAELLSFCSMIETLQQHNSWIYNLECWDVSLVCISQCDLLYDLTDSAGLVFDDRLNGRPFWPTTKLPDDLDYQPIDCKTVQIGSDEIWWSCFIKHTSVRLESAHVSKDQLKLFWTRCPENENDPLLLQSQWVQPDIPAETRPDNLYQSEVAHGGLISDLVNITMSHRTAYFPQQNSLNPLAIPENHAHELSPNPF